MSDSSKTSKNFDITAMSLETKMPVFFIKERLGMPFSGVCTATTLEEAEEAYANAAADSEDQQAALEKRIEFLTTTEQAKQAHVDSYADSRVGKSASKKWISLLTDPYDAQDACYFIQNDSNDDEINEAATMKWIELHSTFSGVISVIYTDYYFYSEKTETAAIDKCLSLIHTPAEALQLVGILVDNEYQKQAIDKVLEFVTDVEKAEEIYNSAPENSLAEQPILEKWAELATTEAELDKLLSYVDDDTKAEVIAVGKYNDVIIQILNSVEKFEDADKNYEKVADSEVETVALNKLIELAGDDLKHLKIVCEYTEEGSDAQKTVIERIAKHFGYEA